MMSIAKQIGLTLLAVGMVAGTGDRAEASAITFNYSGTDSSFPVGTEYSQGGGSFTFDGYPASITLADLTSFALLQTTREYDFTPVPFSYGLANLSSFSATFGQGGEVTNLSFTTELVASTDPYSIFAPEGFSLTSLAPGGASTFSSANALAVGTVTFAASSVPEPPTLALFGITGIGGLVIAKRRRKRDRFVSDHLPASQSRD